MITSILFSDLVFQRPATLHSLIEDACLLFDRTAFFLDAFYCTLDEHLKDWRVYYCTLDFD